MKKPQDKEKEEITNFRGKVLLNKLIFPHHQFWHGASNIGIGLNPCQQEINLSGGNILQIYL